MRLAILEPVSVFAMIMAYIWELALQQSLAMAGDSGNDPDFPLAPWRAAGELGFNRHNLRRLLREFAPSLVLYGFGPDCAQACC